VYVGHIFGVRYFEKSLQAIPHSLSSHPNAKTDVGLRLAAALVENAKEIIGGCWAHVDLVSASDCRVHWSMAAVAVAMETRRASPAGPHASCCREQFERGYLFSRLYASNST